MPVAPEAVPLLYEIVTSFVVTVSVAESNRHRPLTFVCGPATRPYCGIPAYGMPSAVPLSVNVFVPVVSVWAGIKYATEFAPEPDVPSLLHLAHAFEFPSPYTVELYL